MRWHSHTWLAIPCMTNFYPPQSPNLLDPHLLASLDLILSHLLSMAILVDGLLQRRQYSLPSAQHLTPFWLRMISLVWCLVSPRQRSVRWEFLKLFEKKEGRGWRT